MEIDAYKRSETKNFKNSPNYANILDSWFDEYEKNYSLNKYPERNISFLKSRKLETVYDKKDPFSYQYNELEVYIESERSSYELIETEHIKPLQNCQANKMYRQHFNFAFNKNTSENQELVDYITLPNMELKTANHINLAHDGTKKQIADDNSQLAHDGNKKQMIEDEEGNNIQRLGSKELGGNEGMDDKKGKPPNTVQQIKGCNCQELTPEQREAGEKPPPCKCKIEKLRKSREKHKECPECDRIKLNANLIRAIQRINDLQAQRKLTESDVKIILEEEYHGDIFGYRNKKPKLERNVKDEEATGQKTIAERETEMRKEFKEIIESEVAKFEERKKKKPSPKAVTSAAGIKHAAEEELKKTIKRKRKLKKVPLSMEEILKWMYPSHHFGHKHCVTVPRLVPKTMGWLWNSSKHAGALKPGRGWVPGAIRKDVIEVLKNIGKEKRVVEDEERTIARSSRRSGTSKSGESARGAVDKYIPTFHMHKKDGYYYFSLYPVKTDELDKIGQEPKPTMFKVSAKQPDPECSEISTDDDSYEIEFVTPSSMKKQIKKPLKKHISQQYLEEDFSKVKKMAVSDVVEENQKKGKKDKKKKGKKK